MDLDLMQQRKASLNGICVLYQGAGGCPWVDDGAVMRSGVGLLGADFNQGPHLSTHPAEEDALLVMEWESHLWIFSSVHFPDLLAS